MIVDHPILTRCHYSSHGMPAFADGAWFLRPDNLDCFVAALRDDVTLMEIAPAERVFRRIDPADPYPVPESCTPFLDANGLGFYLKAVLPIVFVRNTRGEPLLEARTALKYLRENAARFGDTLELIERYSRRIFRDDAIDKSHARQRFLFSDVVQPYNAFTGKHLSLRAGLWVATPPGVSTVISPPVNQAPKLSVLTGAIETDWHHFELFVVIEMPEFVGQVLVVEPGEPLAQLYFAARSANERAEIGFSKHDRGADPEYAAIWERLGAELVRQGQTKVAERGGTASVEIGCPHCFVSVTAAAEAALPSDHVAQRGFNRAYKVLQHEHRVAAKRDR